MMYGFFPTVGVLFVLLHAFAALCGFLGIVLLVGWILKHAPAHKVKLWALWLIAIGLVLGLLTTPAMFGGRGFSRGGCFGGNDAGQDDSRGSFRQGMMGRNWDDFWAQGEQGSSASSVASSAKSVRK